MSMRSLVTSMKILLITILLTFSFTPTHALLQKIPRKFNMQLVQHAISPISQDVLSSCVALGGATVWLKIWLTLAKNGKVDSRLSRKIIHCGSAPLFICLWPLYSSNGLSSRAIAAFIPLVQIIRLVSAGLSVENSSESSPIIDGQEVSKPVTNELVNAISRSGSNSEVFGGPLYYTIVLFLLTIVFFRGSPIGVVAICQMAAGDGIADIIGRRWGSVKWPFSDKKSYVGSAAFVIGAFSVCTALLSLLSATGSLGGLDVASKLPQLFLISVVCALVELIPVWDDNFTVPVAAVGLSWFLL
mmetsp:Transcript_32283/g.30778  ORF Transcript_32283/g.30778 Transcript_32283/m.30778 type:complete len:301 (-) Transcript_32283:582-1484(-)